jgi:hypothetical protein
LIECLEPVVAFLLALDLQAQERLLLELQREQGTVALPELVPQQEELVAVE